jgi:hypothetical protein
MMRILRKNSWRASGAARRISSWGLNGSLLCGSIVLCLICIEFIIRFLGLAPDVFLQTDPKTGVWHIPNTTGTYFRKDIPKTPVKINAHGLRDHEYPLSKPEHTYRIAVLGDSFTEAIHVPLEFTYQQQVEERLNALKTGAEQIEVINFGVGGFSTAQEYLVFKYHVLPYQPDMVVLAFMLGNDIFENSPILNGRAYLPYFTLSSDGNLQQIPPQPVPLYMQLGRYMKLIPFLYYRVIDGNSSLERWLRGIRRMETETSGIPLPYHVYAPQWNATWNEAWKITQQILFQLHTEVTTKGMQFLLIAIPEHVQVNPVFRTEVLSTYPAMRNQKWEWEKPNRLLRDFCKSAIIPFFDLSEEFEKHIARITDHYIIMMTAIGINKGIVSLPKDSLPFLVNFCLQKNFETKVYNLHIKYYE